MTYKVSDIVKKAEQLSDLTNTDFITWNEKISLLNDAYTMLYQKLVDIGDGSFVKTFEAQSGENILPPDFWQLKSVNLVQNKVVTPVKRRASSENYTSLSYEIRYDRLYINGLYYSGDIVVDYWAKPVTLTYKPEPVILEPIIQEGFDVVGVHDNKFISVKVEEHVDTVESEPEVDEELHTTTTVVTETTTYTTDVNIYDAANNTEKSFTLDGRGIKVYPSTNKMGIFINNETFVKTTTTVVTEPEEGEDPIEPVVTTETTHQDDKHNVIYTYINKNVNDVEDVMFITESGTIGCINSNKDMFIGNRLVGTYDYDVHPFAFIVCNDELSDFWEINEGLYHNGENVEAENGGDNYDDIKMIQYKNGCCWYVTDEEIGYFDPLEYLHVLDDLPETLGINKIDENTGYGYSVWNGDETYTCYPWVEDTVLDFPNSMYFTIMSYMLAVQFKIKQGADAQGLLTVLGTLENTFYDTLAQDANEPVRIRNVY